MQEFFNSDIPPETALVLSAANKINPVTPEGTPTVASQVMQAAGMAPQPMQQPMQQPPQMGLPQAGKMAGMGAQVGAMQQQQEQQQAMQLLQQLAQREKAMNFGLMAAPGAQQFQGPGMAGGGIVGYAVGGDTQFNIEGDPASAINQLIQFMRQNPDMPEEEKRAIGNQIAQLSERQQRESSKQEKYPGLMQYEGRSGTLLPRTTGYEGMGIADALSAMLAGGPEKYREAQRKALEEQRARNMRIASGQGDNQRPTMQNDPRIIGSTAPEPSGVTFGFEDPANAIAKLTGALRGNAIPENERAAFEQQIAELRSRMPPASSVAAQQIQTAQAAQPSGGIAQLVVPPSPSSIDRLRAQYLSQIDEIEDTPVKTADQLIAEERAFRAAQGLPPDPDSAARQRLADLRAEAETEQKRRAKTPKEEMWDKLIAGLAGAAGTSNIGYMGAGIARGTKRAEDAIEDEKQRNFKLFRDFKQAEARELDLMEKAKEQRLYGHKAEADRLAALARTEKNRKLALKAQSTIDFGKMEEDRTKYEAEIAGRANVAGIQAGAELAKVGAAADERQFARLQTSYSLAQQRVVDATQKAQEVLMKRHPLAKMFEMSAEARTKNAEAYASYLADRARLEDTLIKPAIAQREAIAAQLGLPQASPNAPAPGEVMDGYRFKGGNPADKANWEKV